MSHVLTRIFEDGCLCGGESYLSLKHNYEGLGSHSGVSESGKSIKLMAKDKTALTERSIIAALADYPHLKSVELVNADITDKVAEALLKLPELASLGLSTGFFSHRSLTFNSLAFLREAKQLTSLSLYDTSPPVGINELHRLQTITADDNTLCDLRLLEPLQALEQLYLEPFTYDGGDFPQTASSKIKDVRPLKHLPKLHSLALRFDGDMNGLAGFAELKQLKRLSVELARGYDITPFGVLEQLEALWLSADKRYARTPSCPIPSIEALAGLVNLTVLSVCGVKLKSLEPVRHMKNLRELYCSDNHIRTLRPLAGLVGLQALDIANNPIKDFTPIRGLPHYSKRWESMEETAAYFDLDIPPETSGLLFHVTGKDRETKRQVTISPGETVALKKDERIFLGDVTDSRQWRMQKAAFKDFDAHIDLIMKGGPAFFLADYYSGERYMIYEDEGQRFVMSFDSDVCIPYSEFKPAIAIGIIGSLKRNREMESLSSDAIKQCIARLEEKQFWKQADIVTAQIREIALRFMESAEMIAHLSKGQLPPNASVDIIMASRASLSEKTAALQLIYDMMVEVNNAFRYRCEAYGHCIGEIDLLIEAAKFALKETSSNIPAGTVFILKGYNRGIARSYSLFTDFEAAKERLLKEAAAYEDSGLLYYVIEKWILIGNDTMIKTISWYLSHKGAIWFAVINKEADKHLQISVKYVVPSNYQRILAYKRDPKLAWMTVPFERGDIVAVDCRPTRDIMHAVISDISSGGADCRGITCIYVAKDGKITESLLSHDLSDYGGLVPLFTGMLNLTKFKGQLPFEERPLQRISEDIKHKR